MLNLIPYAHRNNTSVYNPFQMFDDLEKRFFGRGDIAEFKTDIRDEGDHYLMEADLPGFKKEDIHIDLDDNTLTIRAERHSNYEEQDKKEAAEKAAMRYHRIRSGDTLGALARRYGTTVSNICRLNGIKSTTILRIGRTLRVR